MTDKPSINHDSLRTAWRDATRRCLITSFVTHKGGQGRTLGCAHTATDLLRRGIVAGASRKAPRILLLDFDWSAPGLSYIQLADTMNDPVHQKKDAGGTTNQVLLTLMEGLLRQDYNLPVAAHHGILPAEALEPAFRYIEGLLGHATDLVAHLEVIDGLGGDLLLLPAQRMSQIESAFALLGLEQSLFFPAKSPAADSSPATGDPFMASILRLLLLFLIERLELDYLFIDCQAGITPMTWLTATLISDVVVIPTTMFRQALDGTATLVRWLSMAKAHDGWGREVPYGPDLVLPYISNLPLSLWDTTPDKRLLGPKDEVIVEFFNAVHREPSLVLPYVERLAERERFVSPSREASGLPDPTSAAIIARYTHGVETLATNCEKALASKRSQMYVLSDLARRVAEHARALKGSGTVTLRIEKGAFGEEPFQRLQDQVAASGVSIKVTSIEHDVLLRSILKKNNSYLTGTDLLAFPHYLLGSLASSGAIVPLNSLTETPTSLVFEMQWLDRFLLARETCFFGGTLYAFPFSVLEKLILVPSSEGTPPDAFLSWKSFVAWLAASGPSFPLLLENDFRRVGVWYDWLEVIAAFGGEDFRRDRDARGSDYGTCWLNNPATVDGTHAYLRLFWDGLASTAGNLNWEDTIERLLSGGHRACFAWSDILNHRWEELQHRFTVHRIPVDTPTRKRTIVEGWVIGVPSGVPTDRYGLIESFMAWFLSEEIQQTFANCGGSPSLKLDAKLLPEVLRLVHASILDGLDGEDLSARVAPKISFPEAPCVVDAVCKALKEMVELPKHSHSREVVRGRLNELARTVTKDILHNKARLVYNSERSR